MVLCTDQGFKVYMHEILVKRYTNLLDAFESIEGLRDPFGLLVIVLQGVRAETLQALCHLLYTGECKVASEEDLQALRNILEESIDTVQPDTKIKTELSEACTIKREPSDQDDVFDMELALSAFEPQTQRHSSQAENNDENGRNSQSKLLEASNKDENSWTVMQDLQDEIPSGTNALGRENIGKCNAVESSSGKTLQDRDKLSNYRYRKLLFKCSQCRKEFRHRIDFIRHKRTHKIEKPYQCSYCGKKFTEKENLRVHKCTHTGEMPYLCPLCVCNNGRNVKCHGHAAQTGETPFQCTICEKWFSKKAYIQEHQRASHSLSDVNKIWATGIRVNVIT